MDESRPLPAFANISILTERIEARATAMPIIRDAVKDHFVGSDLLATMDFQRAAQVVRDNLPTAKRVQSGDLGELFATEYVTHRTDFRVPLKRLRYKDDRDMPLRGDDLIGLRQINNRTTVLKAEVKSRAAIYAGTIGEACDSLVEHESRPKPSTLAFMARMLRRDNLDADAQAIEDMQTKQLRSDDITHMVFAIAGNDPSTALSAHAGPRPPVTDRRFVGMHVTDHDAFVSAVFEEVDAPVP